MESGSRRYDPAKAIPTRFLLKKLLKAIAIYPVFVYYITVAQFQMLM